MCTAMLHHTLLSSTAGHLRKEQIFISYTVNQTPSLYTANRTPPGKTALNAEVDPELLLFKYLWGIPVTVIFRRLINVPCKSIILLREGLLLENTTVSCFFHILCESFKLCLMNE